MSAQDVSNLFEPIKLGSVTLKNRIIMAPMTRSRADDEGVPSELMTLYYKQRAGAGLIITEGTQPSYQGQGYPFTPGIHTAAQVEGWKKITDAVHAEGGKIAIQIMHVGRVGHVGNQKEGHGLFAPSAIPAQGEIFTKEGMKPMSTPSELTVEGIQDIVEQFRKATALAFEAGFDAVEFHSANGYIGNQFLSTNTNHRTDEYGGTPEKRARFVVEVLEAMASVDGAGRIGVRFSPGGSFNDIHNEEVSETYKALFPKLKPLGLAWTHFQHTGWPQEELYDIAPAPLILAGEYDGPKASETIAAGSAAAIAFGRPFLGTPDLPRRIQEGLPLNDLDFATFFAPGATPEAGYTDYPTWDER